MAAGSDRSESRLISRVWFRVRVLRWSRSWRRGWGLSGSCRSGFRIFFLGAPSHDPGRVLIDLATTLIDGGDCVSDLGVLAEQPDLFGAVASHSTATRLLHAL